MSVSVLTAMNAALLRIDVRVEDADWLPLYDRLEVWRSILGEGGPYEELSAYSWQLPAISCKPGAQVNIVGKQLDLLLNEHMARAIVFTGTDPLTITQVATQLGAQARPLADSVLNTTTGELFIRAGQAGGLASIRIVGGDAAAILGLPTSEPDSLKYGQDPRVPLTVGQNVYSFTDYWSQDSYFYKTRFSNSINGAKSAVSDPVAATMRLGVDPAKVAIGYVRLLQPDGRPASAQEVMLYNTYNSTRIDGCTIVGGPKKLLTDSNGYVEFPLLRGLVFDVGIGGTSYIRKVTTPLDPTVLKFDCFDPKYGEDDNFSVQQADVPYAQRGIL
jgi:hypothetical protein